MVMFYFLVLEFDSYIFFGIIEMVEILVLEFCVW